MSSCGSTRYYPDLGRFWSAHQRQMDTWPSNTPANTAAQSEKNRKGKAFLPCPLLEGGALTSATLREDEQGRFEWVTAQGRSSSTSERCSLSDLIDATRIGRKLVCGEEAVLAFPNTRSPQPHQRTTSLLQRAEHGVRILMACSSMTYPTPRRLIFFGHIIQTWMSPRN